MNTEKPWPPVLIGGIVTTALTLLGVHLLNQNTDENVMGWYANYIIPVGPILVGLIAASGYGLVSWLLNIKFNKTLMLAVLGIQLLAYIGTQYIEYQDAIGSMKRLIVSFGDQAKELKIRVPSFFEYYDRSAQSLHWKSDRGGAPTPLGVWGYGIRFLEVIGFLGGSVISPVVLASHPFCERCQRYMRAKEIAIIPAGVPNKLYGNLDLAAMATAKAEGQKTLEQMKVMVEGKRTEEFKALVRELKARKKEASAAARTFRVSLMRCPNCQSGYLRLQLVESEGGNIKMTEVEKIWMSADFIRSIS